MEYQELKVAVADGSENYPVGCLVFDGYEELLWVANQGVSIRISTLRKRDTTLSVAGSRDGLLRAGFGEVLVVSGVQRGNNADFPVGRRRTRRAVQFGNSRHRKTGNTQIRFEVSKGIDTSIYCKKRKG